MEVTNRSKVLNRDKGQSYLPVSGLSLHHISTQSKIYKSNAIIDSMSFRWLTMMLIALFVLLGLGATLSLLTHPRPLESDSLMEDDSDHMFNADGKQMEVAVMEIKSAEYLYQSNTVVTDIIGQHITLSIFTGRVLLIANTATECGYTKSNFEAFATLLRKYHEAGLDVFVFPCNEFGGQEPGTNEEIRQYIQSNYDPAPFIMSKMLYSIHDNDLFTWLRAHLPSYDAIGGGPITWNFKYVNNNAITKPLFFIIHLTKYHISYCSKFLVNRGGQVVRRYPPEVDMAILEADVVAQL